MLSVCNVIKTETDTINHHVVGEGGGERGAVAGMGRVRWGGATSMVVLLHHNDSCKKTGSDT